MKKNKLTFGVIVGTRGCFSSELARDGRKQLLRQLKALGHRAVILPAGETPSGAVETLADARKCADLFSQHRHEIGGVIVSLPNFGDELGVVNTLHWAKLGVPVLVQASDDDLDKLGCLVRSYFAMNGQHIQFNVVDVVTLRAAQANPERYRSLIVRVAGYSDYFCDLGKALQDEIITRTEHESF